MTEQRSTEDTLLASDRAQRPSPKDRSAAALPRGAVVGRYVVLANIGAGAMGVVYAAYDPELDRKVALKLLHSADVGSTGTSSGSRRLLREAQAMAKLSHPNAIAVHDVGEHDGRVYLAMEFVEGTTLREWILARPRSWRELLDVIAAAGRGLAAAHACGLVHRDFKPDNVMVASDGRVRVMDFGLAQPSKAMALVEGDDLVRSLGSSSTELTRDDGIVGTPAYMAPEQYAGGEVTAAADQFAFCVTLWEALYGQRPFSGASLAELAAHVSGGHLRVPPSGAQRVPVWLRRVCLRGLAADPSQRFASIDELLAALERGQSHARLRTLAAGAGVVALSIACTLAYGAYDRQQRERACDRDGAAIVEVWNDERRAVVREGLEQSGASYASTTADKIMPWLDARASEWAQARTLACTNTTIDETWDADLLDRAVWCLDERRLGFDALLTELSTADPQAVQSAAAAAAGRGDRLHACTDAEMLRRSPAPPHGEREAVEAVRVELARVSAMWSVGAYEDALQIARTALSAAEASGWAPIVARTRLSIGELLERTAQYEEAERALEQTYFQALEAGAIEVAIDAADELVATVGYRAHRHDEGLRWAKHAEALRAMFPAETSDPMMSWVEAYAAIRAAKGELAVARELYEQALAVRTQELGPEHYYVALTLQNLATIGVDEGRYDEARELYQRALAIREDVFGSDHPSVADTMENLANLERITGDHAKARQLSERALQLRERALGPDHPEVAMSLTNLGIAHAMQGDLDGAARLHERALAIQEKVLGPDHLHVASSLGSLSELHTARGELATARPLAERALEIQQKVLGPDHPDVALGLANLAAILIGMKSYAEARVLDERALAILRASVGEANAVAPPIIADLARIAAAEGRADEAAALSQRVLDLHEKTVVSPEVVDVARSILAGH